MSVLEGYDTLAIMPTGGGKSICFQVPALAMDGLCLVISPLIALMKDQVGNLKSKGIEALIIHSGMRFMEVKKTLENALYGNFKFLYVSPERLESNLFAEYLPALPLNLIAVDEAHCISQWGYDFRPSYLKIAKIREKKPGVPILALTASATKLVRDDLCEKLLFTDPKIFQRSYERPNLSYSVFNVDVKVNKLLDILKKIEGSGIVYCRSRRRTQEIAGLLNLHGIQADFYHAGLSHEERNEKQEAWIRNEVRVIVCTNAFGMGIDKPNVRAVVHVDLPECLENYYQEAGRAGRDGKKSWAVLLYNEKDLDDLGGLSSQRFPGMETIRSVYQSLVNYLQLPSGSGENLSFDLDLDDFTKKFRLDINLASNAIKVLEQEEKLSYDEQLFQPSTVMFTAGREGLERFEQECPALEPYIKVLLRSYAGILDSPVIIREKNLAWFMRKGVDDIKNALRQLQMAKILEYQPQKDKPQVRFRQNRVSAENLTINMVEYQKRKKAFEDRAARMIGYTKESTVCRSRYIAVYFNDQGASDCGVCDNCIQKKKTGIRKPDFLNISSRIFKTLELGAIPVKDLLQNLDQLNAEQTMKIIDHLIAERKLELDDSGKIRKCD